MMNINSVSYWNARHTENDGSWEKCGGVEQTTYWGELILKYLPQNIKNEIMQKKYSIADIGTGLGQIASLFKKIYCDSRIVGYDFSDIAIDRCVKKYNDIEFICGGINENHDITILSNIIEHIENPIESLIKHFDNTDKYCVVLCPYKEDSENLVPEHVVSIDETILIDKINGFKKTFQEIIDVTDSGNWSGEMILCVYEKEISAKPINKIQPNKKNKNKNK
jgi:SAM-dependent methyltransferase